MSKNDTSGALLGAGALLAVLGIAGAGVFAWKVADDRNDTARGNAAAGGQLPAGPVVGPISGTLPPGSTAPITGVDLAAQLAEQQRRAAEQQAAALKQQQITQLRQRLAAVQNDMDVQVVAANRIKNAAPDAAFQSAVSARVWDNCRNSGPWLTQAARCHNGNMGPEVARTVAAEWAAKVAAELQPYQAQLSRLNAEQLSIIDNLRALGIQLQAAEVRKVAV